MDWDFVFGAQALAVQRWRGGQLETGFKAASATSACCRVDQ